mgnify:CR=1 FL=1
MQTGDRAALLAVLHAGREVRAGQVRQPINRRGLDQWKPYEQWLGPLKRALGAVMEDWDA